MSLIFSSWRQKVLGAGSRSINERDVRSTFMPQQQQAMLQMSPAEYGERLTAAGASPRRVRREVEVLRDLQEQQSKAIQEARQARETEPEKPVDVALRSYAAAEERRRTRLGEVVSD